MAHSSKADEFLADAGLIPDATTACLEHFGIKGMHWGIRRPLGRGGRVAGHAPAEETNVDAARKKVESSPHKGMSDDKLKAETDLLKGKDSLSNVELKKLNERLNLEQNYMNLMEQRKKNAPKSKGEKFIEGMKATGGVLASAVAFSNTPAGKAIVGALLAKGSTPASQAKPSSSSGPSNLGKVNLKPYPSTSKTLVVVPRPVKR